MKPSTIEVWLWLLLVMCPYNRKTTELLEHFDSAEELACAIRDGNCPGLSEAEKQRARNIRSRSQPDHAGVRTERHSDHHS